jgi:hypothetical protein
VSVNDREIQSWKVTQTFEGEIASSSPERCSAGNDEARAALLRNFEFRLPLIWLLATPLDLEKIRGEKSFESLTTRLRLRFSLWKNRLPVDALPLEGWIDLELLAEEDLLSVEG